MKIRVENVEVSNIKSMPELIDIIAKIKKTCDELEALGEQMKSSAVKAGIEFTSANYTRLMDALARYKKETNKAQQELDELLKSSKAYSEHISDIWRRGRIRNA